MSVPSYTAAMLGYILDVMHLSDLFFFSNVSERLGDFFFYYLIVRIK